MSASEEWRDIVGADGYAVSSAGRVRGPKGILSTEAAEYRYPTVSIRYGDRRVVKRVHVLVLEAFVGPRRGLACHRDDDPHNNRLENLYWGTTSQNIADRSRNAGRTKIAISLSREARERLEAIAAREYHYNRSAVIEGLILGLVTPPQETKATPRDRR